MAQHVRVCPGDLDVGSLGKVPQAAGGRVPVHPGTAGVQKDRPAGSGAYCPVDRSADRWRQRHQHDLGALAAHPQYSVTMLLAECNGSYLAERFPDLPKWQAQPATNYTLQMSMSGRVMSVSVVSSGEIGFQ
jgi:hypothetical protein